MRLSSAMDKSPKALSRVKPEALNFASRQTIICEHAVLSFANFMLASCHKQLEKVPICACVGCRDITKAAVMSQSLPRT